MSRGTLQMGALRCIYEKKNDADMSQKAHIGIIFGE